MALKQANVVAPPPGARNAENQKGKNTMADDGDEGEKFSKLRSLPDYHVKRAKFWNTHARALAESGDEYGMENAIDWCRKHKQPKVDHKNREKLEDEDEIRSLLKSKNKVAFFEAQIETMLRRGEGDASQGDLSSMLWRLGEAETLIQSSGVDGNRYADRIEKMKEVCKERETDFIQHSFDYVKRDAIKYAKSGNYIEMERLLRCLATKPAPTGVDFDETISSIQNLISREQKNVFDKYFKHVGEDDDTPELKGRKVKKGADEDLVDVDLEL